MTVSPTATAACSIPFHSAMFSASVLAGWWISTRSSRPTPSCVTSVRTAFSA